MKTLADVEVELQERGIRMVALDMSPGWGVTVNGELIVGPVDYKEAEMEMVRLSGLKEVRS